MSEIKGDQKIDRNLTVGGYLAIEDEPSVLSPLVNTVGRLYKKPGDNSLYWVSGISGVVINLTTAYSGAVNTEIINRIAGDTLLQSQITFLSGEINVVSGSILTEIINRQNADSGIISTLDAFINAMSGMAIAYDVYLESQLTALSGILIASDNLLQTGINTLSGNLIASGTLLTGLNNTEITNRSNAIANAQAQINVLSGYIAVVSGSVVTETTNRTNTDTHLQNEINVLSGVVIAGDVSLLQIEVDTLTSNVIISGTILTGLINAEGSTRTNNDAFLQGQINALNLLSGNIGTIGTIASGSIYAYTYYQTTASPYWNVIHNLNTTNIMVQTYGSNNSMFIPDAINIIDANTIQIVSTVVDSGRVVIIGGIDNTIVAAYQNNLSGSLIASGALLTGLINTEITNRSNADAFLQGEINTLSGYIGVVSGIAINGDNYLQAQINVLSGTIIASDVSILQAEVNVLSGNLITSGTLLTGLINTEITNRSNAVANSQSQINALSGYIAVVSGSVVTEATNRTNADAYLQYELNTLSGGVGTNAQLQITILSGNIVALSGSLNSEITNRSNAEANLQGQINTLSGLTNVASGTLNTRDNLLQSEINIVSGNLNLLSGTVISRTFQNIYDATGNTASFKIGSAGSFTINDQDNPLLVLNDGGTVSLIPGVANGNVFIGSPTISGNLTVYGSLNILGTTTTIGSTITSTQTRIMLLNSGEVGAGITAGSGGIQVSRGSLSNATLLFQESTGKWQAGIIGNTYNIASEANLFASGTALISQINSEITNRQNADANSQSQINVLSGYINVVSGSVITETTNRTNADAYLQYEINALSGVTGANTQLQINIVSGLITTETTNRSNADAVLQGEINTLSGYVAVVSGSVVTEITNRTNADAYSTYLINTVSGNLITSGTLLTDSINTAITNRIAGDNLLTFEVLAVSGSLANEITNRQNADAYTAYLINNLSGTIIASDVSILQGEVNILSGSLIASGTLLTGLVNTEITNRQNADANAQAQVNTLSGYIAVVSGSVLTEATNRTNADNYLQYQINTVSGSVITVTSGFVYNFVQPSASAVWTINHNLNTVNLVAQTYDGNNNAYFPNSISIIDANNVQIVNNYADSGRVVLVGGVSNNSFGSGGGGGNGNTGITRQTTTIANSGIVTLATIFGTSPSAKYDLWKSTDPLLEATLFWDGSTNLRVYSTDSRVTVAQNTASSLNIYVVSGGVTIQNLTGSSASLIVRQHT